MTNPKVRDTVFCKYMSTGDHLLALLNAIKGTSYTDPSNIKNKYAQRELLQQHKK